MTHTSPIPEWAGSTQVIFDDEGGIEPHKWDHWQIQPHCRSPRSVREHAVREAIRKRQTNLPKKVLVAYWHPLTARRPDGSPMHLYLREISGVTP